MRSFYSEQDNNLKIFYIAQEYIIPGQKITSN